MVVLVLSSHDYADNPTFGALNESTHPTRKPISALTEGITRYLPRYLPKQNANINNVTEADRFESAANPQEVKKGLSDLRRFLELAKKNSTHVLVFQHWAKSEIENGKTDPGNKRIQELCAQLGISPISLAPFFQQSIAKGLDPYRDDIHPNQIGQQLIAEAIMKNISVKPATEKP
jgi:lysophospholipase L1-like esterase